MLKQLKLSALIALGAIITTATDQYVTIGTNTFGFAFGDTTLSTNMQTRIIEDWSMIKQPWTNIVVRKFERVDPSDTNDYLVICLDVFTPPYFYDDINLQSFIAEKEDNQLHIVLDKKISDAYKSAFEFTDSNREIFNSVTNLVNALKNDNLRNMPASEITNYLYEADGIYFHDSFKRDLLCQEYYYPSVLSFTNIPAGTFDYPESAYWMLIPIRSNLFGSNTVYPAVYRNNKWYLWMAPF